MRYVFRQTPLPIHEFAAKAAEAALAAHEQKRFWEYANILFHNQNALDVASLKRHASAAGLNVERFARDLDSGRLAPTVQEEKRAAARCGVAGTPKFFVNGVVLLPSDYSVEGIRGILDREFAKVGPAPASSAGLAR